MKPILHFLFVLCLSLSALPLAAQQQGFAYQAVARDQNGAVLANQSLTVKMVVRANTANGLVVFEENHSPATNDYGLFTLSIGNGAVVTGTFETINWVSGPYFLDVQINGVSASNEELQAVPFAKVATDMRLDDLQDVEAAFPVNHFVLKYNGAVWVPASDSVNDADADPGNELQSLTLSGTSLTLSQGGGTVNLPTGTTYTAGTGIGIAGNTISNTGDTNPSDDITTSTAAGGDVSGQFPTLTVVKIQNQPVSNVAPAVNQVLKWNGSSWAPATDLVSSGGGAVNVSARLAGDGSAGSPLDLAGQGATNGQVLKFNGTSWAPAGDVNTTYSAGAGLTLAGTTFSAIDPSATNEIQALTLSGNTLSLSNGGGSVALPAGTTYTAGTGISLAGNVVTNTGDTNPADDITTSTAAGGDLTGTYPNPSVDGLQGIGVSATAPTNGQVLKYNGTAWAPAGDVNTTYSAGGGLTLAGTTFSAIDPSATNEIQALTLSGNTLSLSNGGGSVALPAGTTYTAGTGISLAGNVVTNTGDTNPSDDITTSTAAGGDLTGTYPNPSVDGLQGIGVSATAPTNGQVLKYNGTAWAPAGDVNTTYSAGAGLTLTGTTFSAIDPSATNEIQALTLSGNTLSLSNGGGSVALPAGTTYTAGTGISLAGNVVTNTGDTNPSDDITTSTAAGGDLTGTYPNPSVDGLQGIGVSATAPTNGQVLKYNGTAWAPSGDVNTTYSAGAGLTLTGTTFSAIDPSATNEIQALTLSGNTLSLSNGGGSVALPAGTTYTAGTGISLAGNVVTNTGDTNAADDITTSTAAGGDLTGTYPNPSVDGLQGIGVSATAPTNGQVLKYNGTAWAPSGDNNTTYSAGSGLTLSGTTFSAVDQSSTNEIQVLSLSGSNLSLSNGGGTVALPSGTASQWTTAGSAIHYNTGNVGIGDATPANTLTVGNGDKFQVSGTDGDVLFTDPQGTIRFPALTAPGAAPMIQMFTSGTQNADRMVISHSPSFPTWGIQYKDTTDVLYFRDGSARKFAFELSSGHMGIGPEDPQFPLDMTGRMRIRSTGILSNSPGIWFQNNTGTFDRAFFGMSEPDSLIGIYSQHLGKWAIEFEVMREPRIGINIPAGSPPRAEIHLYHTNFGGSNDGIRIQNEGSNAHYWNLYTSNTTGDFEFFKSGIKRATINQTSGTYTAVSDARLKKNIAPLGAVLPTVLTLQPKTYQYNDMEDERYFTGFLAQELNEQFPQFVYYGGDDQKYFTVDYAGLSVIALKAIQEQQAQVEALKAALEVEKQRNDALEARLRRLETLMEND